MNAIRLAAISTAAVALAVSAIGCHTISHREEPIPRVIVRDAETKKPIDGAKVTISNDLMTSIAGKTGSDGVVQVKKFPADDGSLVAEATANGYLTELKDLRLAVPGAAGKTDSAMAKDGAVPETVIDVFAEPRPKVELRLPVGFRGRIEVDLEVREESQAGEQSVRSFAVAVGADGIGKLEGSAILRHIVPVDFTAIYADGSPAPAITTDSDIGFRWVKSTERTLYFIVGTMVDCKEYRKSLEGMPQRDRSSGEEKKAGGGRGGRHGGGRGGH